MTYSNFSQLPDPLQREVLEAMDGLHFDSFNIALKIFGLGNGSLEEYLTKWHEASGLDP